MRANTGNHRNVKIALAGFALVVLAGCSAQTTVPGAASVEDRNRAVVLRYMQEVINQRELDVLDELMVEDWIAHNPTEPNGREGLKRFFDGAFQQFPELHADVKRVVAEKDLVAVQTHYTISKEHRGNDWAPGSGATVDIFRLENGKIVEHWDVHQRPIPEESVNGNTMFDGGALYNYRR